MTALAAIDDEATKRKLGGVATDRLRKMGRITRPTAIFVDKSGSMQAALKLGAHVWG